ncbi:leucine-rich repeat domain-containing protein [Luteolibacter pohnpeiensis]|uniref:Leucine-rich repeat domain-containing protein n=1 Tax=Luteolibacter pohnpeiensis TaxID=454153 RepID=A0A934VVJ6_9BACT|nr:leucine-rich repeat domain-containing protein [Luteolibacter pohnpeiensis]MBK1881873.1 leucine-rich repeat domain-containing protein [Luteolibacter pohnpeiensis]
MMKTYLTIASLVGLVFTSHALADSTYTYVLQDSVATITGFTSTASPSGAIAIPSTVDGYVVGEIGAAAFKNQTAVTSITFASSVNVTRIGISAFQGCTALASISLPSSITQIDGGAFADCSSLTTISLPDGLTTLGESVFLNCESLVSLTIPDSITTIPGQLCDHCTSLTTLSLSDAVTEIGNAAFYDCSAMASFTMPESLVTLGDDAFHGCGALTTITMGDALSSIGDRVFQDCDSLVSISVSSGNPTYSSEDGVLLNASQTSVVLCPEGKLGDYTIPVMVESLAEGAFAHCDLLTSVSLPSGLTDLPADAFYYASGLESVELPTNISSIGDWCFAGCSSLAGVTFPEALTTLGDDSFDSCLSLEWALFNGDAPDMGESVFDHTADAFTVYYYSSSTGFESPTWLGYPAVALEIPSSFATWLTGNGYSPGTSMATDTNSDGVSLLMAYALNLDPSENLASSMPQPVLADDEMSLSFYGNSSDVTYTAETSTDLENWTTDGVSLSDPDANGLRTAEVAQDGASRFIRLVVSY